MPKYRKPNFPLISIIYLVFLHLEMLRKTQTDQSVPHVFLLCLKLNDPQTVKSGSSKNPFSQCVLLVQLASKNAFLFYVTTERHYFS